MFANPWITFPAVALAVSAALLWFALRGRRVDDHPICRKCGFDLYGKPAGSTVCSECGGDMGCQRAIRIGHRQSRRGLIWLALPGLLLCLGWFGLLGWGGARGVDWNRHKPGWWLVREMNGTDAVARDKAVAELIHRFDEGKLSHAHMIALVDKGLDEQAGRTANWRRKWERVIEQAHDSGRLPADRWQRYARQAVVLNLRVRPRLRPSGSLGLRIEQWYSGTWGGFGRHRFLITSRMGHRVEVSGHAVELSEDNWAMDGEAEPGQWGRKAQLGLWGFASASWAYTEWPEVFKYIHYSPLRPGPQTVRVPVDVRVYEPPPGFKHLATWDPAAQRPLVETTIELTQSWELIREGDPYLVRKDDPSLRPAVEGAIEVIPEACTPGSPGWRNWELRAVAHNPPVGLSFKVSVRAGGREWKVRPEDFTCAAGGTELEIWRFALPDSAGDRVDVILRPDPEAGRFDNRVEYWDGEVVIRGVRLKPEVR